MLESTNGYYAVLQADGNFVIYRSKHFIPRNYLWQSNTAGKGRAPFRLELQKNGNLVLYDSQNSTIWNASNDNKSDNTHRLVLQNDGNLVIYSERWTWATQTGAA